MKLLTPVAPRWYSRLNEASLTAGILILVGFLVLKTLVSGAAEDKFIGINPGAAVIATITIIYSLIGFKVLNRRMGIVAGFISYVLLTASIGTLVYSTGGFSSQYLLLWVVVILFSAMFGWLSFGLVWVATHAYFLALITGQFGEITSQASLAAYLVALELPFIISWFLWYGQSATAEKTELVDNLVNTGDISQGMLISSIAEGVVVIDDKYQIQVFNPAAVRTTGWSEQDAKGIDYHTVLTLIDQNGQKLLPQSDPILQVFTKAETVVSDDIRIKTRNNHELDLSFVASPIVNKNGGVVSVVAVFRDVSEERNQERQRAEFISTASHEMRTPVAAIEGYLALAMNDHVSKIDTKAREYLEKAHSSTQHLGKLFQDLLTAAKSEDGRLQNIPKVIEIGQLIDELAEGMRFTAEKKGLVLDYDAASNQVGSVIAGSPTVRPLYFVHADPERLREVVTNLFDNAVKYTAEGKVTVHVGGDATNVKISVSDTGPGIPQEDLPHLFQKFYRVDSTATRQIGGTGLGLFIARKIVELNKGKIWAESELNKGSRFTVTLPRLSAERAEQMKKQEVATETPLSNVTGNVEL